MVKHAGIRLFEMLKDDIMTDVTFVVQGSEIKGHRAVASCQGGLLRELLATENKRIEIEDISPQTLMVVLEYLYTDECAISHSNVFHLMHAAKKFNLADLVYRCSKLIIPSEKNIGAVTAQALNFGAEAFLKQCINYFRENTSKVIDAKEFLEISQEVLLKFCGTERIKCSQMQLFTACIRWAENECQRRNLQNSPENLRTVLGDVIHKLQFENMSMEDFLEFVAPLEILTQDEVGKLIVGWQKKKKYKNWTDEIEVSVQSYAGAHGSERKETKLRLPLSTKISHLKTMKIVDGGKRKCPPELFTMSHNGKVLADDVTLASIYTPGKPLIIQIHSLSVKLKSVPQNPTYQFFGTIVVEAIIIQGDLYKKQNIENFEIVYPYDG